MNLGLAVIVVLMGWIILHLCHVAEAPGTMWIVLAFCLYILLSYVPMPPWPWRKTTP